MIACFLFLQFSMGRAYYNSFFPCDLDDGYGAELAYALYQVN